jgi:hypothetical protein
MSDFVKVKKLTSATGGAVNFPNGINIAGSDSGVTGTKHTVSETEPSTPVNGDTWYDTGNTTYFVRMDNAWRAWIGGSGYWSLTSIANTAYDNKSYSITQDAAPVSIEFNSNGTKMYTVGVQNDYVYQYSLSTPFDVSTASYDSVSFDIGNQASNPQEIVFSTDGTKLFMAESNSTADQIHQYSLSTAFDVSTLSYDNVKLSPQNFSLDLESFAFNPAGTKLFVISSGSVGHDSTILSYSLSTGFDLSTASYDNVSFDASTVDNGNIGIVFSGDGLQFFTVGRTSEKVYQYAMTSPYDLSTASYENIFFSLSNQVTSGSPAGINFNNDGTKMYVMASTNDSVFQYSTGIIPPTFSWGGDRAITVFSRVDPHLDTSTLDPEFMYYDITTTGNAADFGDLAYGAYYHAGGISNGSKCVWIGGGGVWPSSYTDRNEISYVISSTLSNSSDFGDMTSTRQRGAGASNNTRGLYFGGQTGFSTSPIDTIEYITIANNGNSTDFGDMTVARSMLAAASNGTYAAAIGGQDTSSVYTNVIDRVTIDTVGNAADHGDMTYGNFFPSAFGNTTRALISNGQNPSQSNSSGPPATGWYTVDTIDLATSGNASSWGALTQGCRDSGFTGNDDYAVRAGGSGVQASEGGTSGYSNTIDRISMSTAGDATDHGDLLGYAGNGSSCSGAAS